jgi:hypothetical protein
MTIKFLIPCLAMLCRMSLSAQYVGGSVIYGPTSINPKRGIQLIEGNPASLSAISQVNITYDYTQMHIGKYMGEEEYLREEMKGYGKDTANARNFKQRWVQNHYMAFEPGFEASFNEAGQKAGISGSNYSSANAITLQVFITSIDYGFYALYVTKPATISAECVFADLEGNILARYSIQNARQKYTMNETDNITKCYRKAAKMLAKQLEKDRKEKK